MSDKEKEIVAEAFYQNWRWMNSCSNGAVRYIQMDSEVGEIFSRRFEKEQAANPIETLQIE